MLDVITFSAFTQTDNLITGLPFISPNDDIVKYHKEVQANVSLSVVTQESQTTHESDVEDSKENIKQEQNTRSSPGKKSRKRSSSPANSRKRKKRKPRKCETTIKYEVEDELPEDDIPEDDIPEDVPQDDEADISYPDISNTELDSTGNDMLEDRSFITMLKSEVVEEWPSEPIEDISIESQEEEATPRKKSAAPSELHMEPKKSMWRKDEEGNFLCQLCSWTKRTWRSLANHLRTHLDERPYVCSTCGKGFRRSDKLKDHERIHTGERPFVCEICGQPYKTKKAVQRHKLTHSDTKDHICDQCGKAYSSKERLNYHITNVHEESTKISCTFPDCDFKAIEKNTILYHEADKHGCPVPSHLMTVCDICGISVRNSSIRMHQLTHEEKSICCPKCDYRTQYKNTLRSHMQRIHGINVDGSPAVKKHKCTICTEEFFCKQQLTLHILRHEGTKPHKCPFCDFSSVDKGSLKMHVRLHTGERPFRCPSCPKTFKQSSAMTWHIKTVHEGVRSFNCEECGMDYVNKKDLKAHQYSVHLKVKPYQCQHCQYACTKKEYLAQHIRNTHGEELVPPHLLPIRKLNRGPHIFHDLPQVSQHSENVTQESPPKGITSGIPAGISPEFSGPAVNVIVEPPQSHMGWMPTIPASWAYEQQHHHQ